MKEVRKRTGVLQQQRRGKLPFALSKYTIKKTSFYFYHFFWFPELLTDIGQEASVQFV